MSLFPVAVGVGGVGVDVIVDVDVTVDIDDTVEIDATAGADVTVTVTGRVGCNCVSGSRTELELVVDGPVEVSESKPSSLCVVISTNFTLLDSGAYVTHIVYLI